MPEALVARDLGQSGGVRHDLDEALVPSRRNAAVGRPVWKSTSASGAADNSSLSHFSAMTRPCCLPRAVRNRHRHAIEQASRTRREILISTQVAAREFPENFKGTPMLSCSVTPGRTYAPCAYFTTHGLWLGRSETA